MRIMTKDKKDGASMCQAFERMIDEIDKHHNCETVCLCTDCNGGSGRGQKDLVVKRPWLFVPPCCKGSRGFYSMRQGTPVGDIM